MATNIATKDWNKLREIAQGHWKKFTTEDLDKIERMREELVELVQQRYGFAKQRAEQEVDQFLSTYQTKKEELVGNLSAKRDELIRQLDYNLGQYDQKIHGAAQKLPGEMDQTLVKYPWVSLVIALMMGFILGLLLKPRR